MVWRFLQDDVEDEDVLSDAALGSQARAKRQGAAKVLSPFGRVVSFVGTCLSVLFGFIWRWYWTRPRSAFWWGMPAVVVGCSLIGFVAIARQTRPSELITTYNQKAIDAFRSEDFEAADLYFQKMAHLDPKNKATLYGLALTAERQEQLGRATELMQRLAPADSKGDGRAHQWLARRLAQSEQPLDAQGLALLEHHLLQTLVDTPNLMESHRTLGSLYASRKQFDKAIFHLDQVAEADPAALLTVARLNVMADRKATANRVAEKAREHFENLSKDTPVYRLQWTEAELFLLNYQKSAEIAIAGLQLAEGTDKAQWQQVLTTVFVTWYDAISKSDADNLSGRLELLQQAVSFGPNNPQALSRLAEFAVKGNDKSTVSMGQLKQILASGRAPGIVHFILGTSALSGGEEEQGIRHLELAFEQLPQMPAVANNLAWAAANRAEPNLEQAEQLINAAVELAPQHPEISETRGQILAKLGKTKEAIVDLEFTLRANPNRPPVHATLAVLYDELGDAELAEQHRKMAAAPEN